MIVFGGQSEPIWFDPLINFVAVLFGALLAWSTTRYFEKKKELRKKLAVAYSLLFKIQSISSEVIQLERNVLASIEDAERHGIDGPAWRKLSNIVGFNANSEAIAADELALIAVTKDTAMLMDVRELESGHRILKTVLSEISALRVKLEQADLAVGVEGQAVTFAVAVDQYPNLAPTMIGLETLSEQLVDMLPRIVAKARSVSSRVGLHLKDHHKFEHFMTLSMPDDEVSDNSSSD